MVMLFLTLIIIRIAISQSYLSVMEENVDCSSYLPSQRPHLYSYSTPTYTGDFRQTSVNVSNPILASRETFQQLNCTFDRPIEWVFHLDPETDLNVAVDFSERIVNTEIQGDYLYTTNFRLLYNIKDLEDGMLFSCQPVSLENKCERNFIQFYDYGFSVVSVPHESLSGQSHQLLTHNGKGLSRKFPNEISCPLVLILKIEEGNFVYYKWEHKSDRLKIIETVATTNETTFFDNIYRLEQSREPNCVRLLPVSEPCINCSYISNYTLNGVIFYAKAGNNTFVHKGLFSVPFNSRSGRSFYLDWQISEYQIDHEMIQLIIPETLYANVTFLAVCRVSVFFFSFGSQINVGNSLIPLSNKMNTKEYYTTDGYREIKSNITLHEIDKLQTITCFSPLKRWRRWVEKSQTRLIESAIPPKIDDSSGDATIFEVVRTGTESISATCKASGNPKPILTWSLPANVVDESEVNASIVGNEMKIAFANWKPSFAGTYICAAKNFLGITTKSITFQHEEHSSTLAITLSSSIVGLAVILACGIGLLMWKIRKQRLEFEIQTQKAIEEFKNGLKPDNAASTELEDPNFSIQQLPYNERFEILQTKWTIESKILGSGQFGLVRLGFVVIKDVRVKIAVKTMKSTAEIDEFKSFLFELKIMAFLGYHKNIVSLIAACTEGINDRDIMIGVEFCDNGSLLEYLRKHCSSFQNLVGTDGNLVKDSLQIQNSSSDYVNACVLNTHDLYRWSYHIACGMDYLRMQKVLHGDLAARNILLTSRKVAKVGDFGLSRVLKAENYTKKTQVALPWKWMAPESLAGRVFSVNSDKWSYGILLYEIFSLGKSPYAGIGYSPDFVTRLQNGFRLEKPAFCTLSIYKIMQATWTIDPNERPSYAKIKMKLSKGLKQLSVLLESVSEEPEVAESTDEFSGTNSANDRLSNQLPADHVALILDDLGGIYSNIPRRTMNYYKNY